MSTMAKPVSFEAINRDFRVLDAAWPRLRALQMIKRSKAGHVIVRQEADDARDKTKYYLLSRDDAIQALSLPGGEGAADALRLHARRANPTLQFPFAQPVSGAAQVVLREHAPIGFLEAKDHHRGGIATMPLRESMPAAEEVAGEVERDLTARWPDAVESGSTVALQVSLARLGVGAAGASLRAPVGARIDVVVVALEGMTLEGSNTGTLLVQSPQPDQPLMFTLTAGPSGRGAVRVYAYSSGASVAAFDLVTSIFAQGSGPGHIRSTSARASVPAEPRTPPDLSLLVIEAGSEIRYRLQSAIAGHEGRDYPAVPIRSSSRDYFAQFANELENMPVATDTQRKTAFAKIERRGANMFAQLLPGELRQTLWDARERIDTVQITSDEAWIPWEVCRLVGNDGGRVAEGPFFADAFPVTRWLHGVAAPRQFGFGKWALVVPKDSKLPLAPKEQAYVLSLANAHRRVVQVPATFLDVCDGMEGETYQAWHFCGHAHAGDKTDGDKSALQLEARETLRADEFSGRLENGLRSAPFIFFNACQSAQGGLSLTGVGGWAHRFLKPTLGGTPASVFIGSYWSVYDAAAHAFAVGVYDRLLVQGSPIGQAVREARKSAFSVEDPLSWLAYTVYADPAAVAERNDHAAT